MSGLWAWALEAYARPGAEALLLDLQDSQGQCAPYLLWAAWLGAEGRPATPAALAQGAGVAQAWEQEVVGPLRQVRRRLKPVGPEALHRQIKAVELAAERALMGALEALAPPPGGASDVMGALLAAGQAWDPPAEAESLRRLAKVVA